MKKALSILLLILLLICPSCAKSAGGQLFDAVYTDCFDTVSSLSAQVESASSFALLQQGLHAEMQELHALFDVYNDAKTSNLKTLNDAAGSHPVALDARVLDLLSCALDFAQLSGGAVQPMMGAVTVLWKSAAQSGVLPSADQIIAARAHIDPAALIVDKSAGTAYISDPQARVDVGAFAKGYAARLLGAWLENQGCENFLLSLGGNIYAHGVDPRTGKNWQVSVRDPQNGGAAVPGFHLNDDRALVTSGSYERFFTLNGKNYHHIIDPATGYPSARTNVVSVSVLHSDPLFADALSTALFILERAEGEKLLQVVGGSALYIYGDGTIERAAGFPTETSTNTADLIVLIALPSALGIAVALWLWQRKKGEQTKKSPFPKFRKRDCVFLCLVLLIALLLPLLLLFGGKNAEQYDAVVRIDGKEVCRLPLNKNAEYRAESSLGSNLIVIKDGKAFVADADCPGGDCTRCAAIDEHSTIPVIACLPHKLTITIEAQEVQNA